jgi:hypothetical protein
MASYEEEVFLSKAYIGILQYTGADVMILKIYSPKNLSNKLAFLAQNTASSLQRFDLNIDF